MPQSVQAERRFMTQVFGWMGFGLADYWCCGRGLGLEPGHGADDRREPACFLRLDDCRNWFLSLSWRVSCNRPRARPLATVLFLIYAALNGLTLSVIFMVYTSSSIATAFLCVGRHVWRHEPIRLFHEDGSDRDRQHVFYGAHRSDHRVGG